MLSFNNAKIFVLVTNILLIVFPKSTKSHNLDNSEEKGFFNCECGISIFGASSCSEQYDNSRIIGGQEALDAEIPWQAALSSTIDNSFSAPFCGGSLINTMYVLTAAHCFFFNATSIRNYTTVTVHLGITDWYNMSKYQQKSCISKLFVHPHFNYSSYENDIALLKLEISVKFSERVRPICLPTNDNVTYYGEKGVASGWGNSGNYSWATKLQRVNLDILNSSDVLCIISGIPVYDDTRFCTYTMGKGICNGDSGGPLTILEGNNCSIIGIVSHTRLCQYWPSVFTAVGSYVSWIKNVSFEGGCMT